MDENENIDVSLESDKMPDIYIRYLLPLGTVVELKGATHKTMITGHNVSDQIKEVKGNDLFSYEGGKPRIFDYMGVLWPEGDVLTKVGVFNNEDIAKVYFKGFVDEENEGFNQKYDEAIEKINKGN